MMPRQQLAGGGPATFALRLLILSLTVLFVAALVGYGITRARLAEQGEVAVPGLLWVGTAALLATGGLLEAAWRRLKSGRRVGAMSCLRLAAIASVVFLAVQAPALRQLLMAHPGAHDDGNPLLGFVFFLILLHALHVMAGVVALARLLRRTWRRSLVADEDGPSVRLLARYWHFLDLIWVAMFGVFLLG